MMWSFDYRENTDLLRWRDWGRIAFLYNLSDTYKTTHLNFGTLANNMPPGTLYIISAMFNLNIETNKVILKIMHVKEGSRHWMNSQLLNGHLRLPSIASDILLSFLIYKIVLSIRKKEKYALIASSLFLFNPVIIYNSSFWGQDDSKNNLFLFVSLYLIYKRKYFMSLLPLFLSFYIKLSLIFLLPIFIFILYRGGVKKVIILSATVFSLIIICLLTLPISLNSPRWIVNFLIANISGEIQNITAFAFNFWWVIFMPWIKSGNPINLFNFSEIRLIGSPLSNNIYFGLSLSNWAIIIFGLSLLPLLRKVYCLKKKVLQPQNFFLIFSVVVLLGFMLLPRMHERYMYPLFPLLITYYGLSQKMLVVIILLTIFHFINLYIVWHPMILSVMPYTVFDNQFFQWIISLLILLTTIFFYTNSIKKLSNENIQK